MIKEILHFDEFARRGLRELWLRIPVDMSCCEKAPYEYMALEVDGERFTMSCPNCGCIAVQGTVYEEGFDAFSTHLEYVPE